VTSSERVVLQLRELLEDPSNSVIALSGSWGTGKTYLWRQLESELKKASGPAGQSNTSIYVSLFGLRNVDDLQTQIIQAAFLSDDPKIRDTLKGSYSILGSSLKALGFGWTQQIIEQLASMAMPKLLSDRLIVLDDIERKHNSFDVDAVLGFIDRYRQTYGARFLLILNLGRLSDQAVWETFREKVIDHEVVLKPTTEEAFDIAKGATKCPYEDEVRKVVDRLDVTNIRVLQKTVRVVAKVLSLFQELPQAVRGQVIPSLVLLPAIYYKGVADGPPMDFVFSYNQYHGGKDKPPEQAKWDLLLRDLGIVSTDEFEKVLLTYLRTALFQADQFKTVIGGYLSAATGAIKDELVRKFFENYYWNSKKTAEDLLGDLKNIATQFDDLAFATVTALSSAAEDLGDSSLAKQLIDLRIDAFNKWAEGHAIPEPNSLLSEFQPIHPRFGEAVDAVRRKQQPPLPLMEVVARMIKNSGWGDREIDSLSAATVPKYVETLKGLEPKELATFLQRHISWLAPGTAYSNEEGFKVALPCFVEACRQITLPGETSRLAKIIARSFEKSQLGPLLHPTSAAQNGKDS